MLGGTRPIHHSNYLSQPGSRFHSSSRRSSAASTHVWMEHLATICLSLCRFSPLAHRLSRFLPVSPPSCPAELFDSGFLARRPSKDSSCCFDSFADALRRVGEDTECFSERRAALHVVTFWATLNLSKTSGRDGTGRGETSAKLNEPVSSPFLLPTCSLELRRLSLTELEKPDRLCEHSSLLCLCMTQPPNTSWTCCTVTHKILKVFDVLYGCKYLNLSDSLMGG